MRCSNLGIKAWLISSDHIPITTPPQRLSTSMYSIIPELLNCHRGGINSYRISHQTGTKVARFALVYSSANTGHAHWATHDSNQRQNIRNSSPPIPLTTKELLTKQKVHSACLERSSQGGCRLIHEVDTLWIRASWQGTRCPTQGPCVKRIKEPAELVGEGGIASTALYWVQSEQPLQCPHRAGKPWQRLQDKGRKDLFIGSKQKQLCPNHQGKNSSNGANKYRLITRVNPVSPFPQTNPTKLWRDFMAMVFASQRPHSTLFWPGGGQAHKTWVWWSSPWWSLVMKVFVSLTL